MSEKDVKIVGRKKRAAAHKRKMASQGCKACFVYGLTLDDGVIRYIGQTRQSLPERLAMHHKIARRDKLPLQKWLLEHGDKVRIVMLCEKATWDVTEIILIDRYTRTGGTLFNLTRGGPDTHVEAARCCGVIYPW